MYQALLHTSLNRTKVRDRTRDCVALGSVIEFRLPPGDAQLQLTTHVPIYILDMGGATYCSVAGCSARMSHNKGLTYHNVPRKGIGKDQWRRELLWRMSRVDKGFNSDKARICSRHFTEDCFKYGECTAYFVVHES